MPFLIFIGVLIGGAALILVVVRLTSNRDRAPTIPLVRVAIGSGQAETQIWTQALRAAGIWCRVQSEQTYTYGDVPFSWEVWVREKDADRARAVLGVN